MKNRPRNFILVADAYKHTHWLQLPEDLKHGYSYVESRGGHYGGTMFFGLQRYLMDYLVGPVVEQWMIEEAEVVLNQIFGHNYFNRAGWQRIVDVHGGKLPLRIRAVKEGTVVPVSNVLATIEDIDPECQLPWLAQFVETTFLRGIWYPTSVATLSYEIKKTCAQFAKETGCDTSPFYLNDFGARGVSSSESAQIGGMAHLVNSLGTDTVEGIISARDYYDAGICGYSVFATEHFTTTIYGKDHEVDAYRHFLTKCPDDAILSMVIDSYDADGAVRNLLGTKLHHMIAKRKGKTVFRPDSGDPVEMCLRVAEILWDCFGGTVNKAGYRQLPPNIGIIYGDGINHESIIRILQNLKDHGFATDVVVFGMGGALLQGPMRDDQKFAGKCCAAQRGDTWINVYKDPVTDTGKRSKMGRLALVKYPGKEFATIPESLVLPEDNLLELVLEYGELKRFQKFADIRAIAAAS